MVEYLSKLFDTSDFPPRWYCGRWTEGHGWVHILSDLSIFGAYAAIPISIAYFVSKRRDMPFPMVFWLFAAFIFSCGLGHLVEASIFWQPWYRFSGLVKIVTAVASWATVVALVKVLPEAMTLPGVKRLNDELRKEIAERLRAEDEIRRLNATLKNRVEELQALLDMLPVSIGIASDPECRHVQMNPAFAQMLQLPREANASKSAGPGESPANFRILHDGRELALEELPLRVAAGENRIIRDYEEEFAFANGQSIHVLAYAAPLHAADGKVRGAVGAFIDITARKQAEVTRQQVERRFQETQKLESLGVLAGGVAHDFNNLLTGILGNSSLARLQLPSTSPAVEFFQRIEHSAVRAADLCKQMLAYAGKGRVVLRNLDFNHVISDTAALISSSLSQSAELRWQLALALPAIRGDATQIQQVVMNLLLNASEAIGEMRGVISVQTGRRQISRSELDCAAHANDAKEGEYVCMEINDTGGGMAPDVLARIFDPFFSTKFTGRGLGLAAVLGIVRSHGGMIRAESRIAEGTTFTVCFPAVAEPPDIVPAPPQVDLTWRGSGTILLIDDEETVRLVAAAALRSLGFEVLAARNGRDGLNIFTGQHSRITAVLLDLTMPGMDGGHVFRELQRIDPTVKVLLMSGFSEEDAIRRIPEKALAGFLQKPFALDALAAKLHQVLT